MSDTSPDQVMAQVELLLERRRTALARSMLQPALASHPEHTGLLLQSATLDYLEDHPHDALATLRQVLLVEPTHPVARSLYFELLMETQQHAEAERVIIELLRDYPEHASYYGRYAYLMLRVMNLHKASQLADEGLRLDPQDMECLVVRTICDFIAAPNSSSLSLQELLLHHPEHSRVLLLVVAELERRGDVQGARRVARELLQAHPDNEDLVEIARHLNLKAHWSMRPLWPVMKWGWGGSIGIWMVGVIGVRMLGSANPALGSGFAILLVSYVVYSWVWPPVLRRILK